MIMVRSSMEIDESWPAALAAFGLYLLAGGASAGTIRLRASYLSRFAESHPRPWSVTHADLVCWLACPGWGPEARHSARSSVRSFYGWAFEGGLIAADPTARLPRVIVPLAEPRPAPDEVIRAALADADERTRRMILLAALAGLRRAEIASLHTDSIVGGAARITGKGGRVRTVPLHPILRRELAAIPAGWVFPGQDGHLSPDAVGRIMSRALGAGWTAHTLRHAAACAWYSAERDLLAVRRLLGHASVSTTQRYAAPPDGALATAIAAGGTIITWPVQA